jgi:hypothetical protein
MTPEDDSPLRAALAPSALKRALVPHRPVFGNPWDSPADMLACYVAVSVIGPLLLWAGGALMGAIFGFGSHWRLGVFVAAALVGAAGFMTVVGRERTSCRSTSWPLPPGCCSVWSWRRSSAWRRGLRQRLPVTRRCCSPSFFTYAASAAGGPRFCAPSAGH